MLSSEWTATGERNQFIEFDIESTPLQVFTNSEIGSGDVMWVQFANIQETGIVGFVVKFDSNPFYSIGQCLENVRIPLNQLGTDKDRIWTIEKDSNTRVKLYCNGAEIADIDTQASDKPKCGQFWAVDFAGIRFIAGTHDDHLKDTASDFFRKYKPGNKAYYLLYILNLLKLPMATTLKTPNMGIFPEPPAGCRWSQKAAIFGKVKEKA